MVGLVCGICLRELPRPKKPCRISVTAVILLERNKGLLKKYVFGLVSVASE